MTKEQAIEFINSCNKDEKCGFAVVCISEDDFKYHLEDLASDFSKLNEESKEEVLSNAADMLNDLFFEYEFSEDFAHLKDDIECLISDYEVE